LNSGSDLAAAIIFVGFSASHYDVKSYTPVHPLPSLDAMWTRRVHKNSGYPAKGGFLSDTTAREMFNAIEAGNINRVRALVSAEPSLIGATVDNADPLGWAAFYAHPDIVEYFIQAGSDLNWRTSRGTSPLGFAIRGAEGAFKSHGVDRPTHLYEQCVALLKGAGASE
jgi:hypothetical protein